MRVSVILCRWNLSTCHLQLHLPKSHEGCRTIAAAPFPLICGPLNGLELWVRCSQQPFPLYSLSCLTETDQWECGIRWLWFEHCPSRAGMREESCTYWKMLSPPPQTSCLISSSRSMSLQKLGISKVFLPPQSLFHSLLFWSNLGKGQTVLYCIFRNESCTFWRGLIHPDKFNSSPRHSFFSISALPPHSSYRIYFIPIFSIHLTHAKASYWALVGICDAKPKHRQDN